MITIFQIVSIVSLAIQSHKLGKSLYSYYKNKKAIKSKDLSPLIILNAIQMKKEALSNFQYHLTLCVFYLFLTALLFMNFETNFSQWLLEVALK